MVSFLKGRRREDDSVVAIDSSGRDITAALEALVARAETAANDLRSLGPMLERAAEIGDPAGALRGAGGVRWRVSFGWAARWPWLKSRPSG